MSDTKETPVEVPSLRPYREFLLTTLSAPLAAAEHSKVLDETVVISDIITLIQGKESIEWPNQLRFNIPAEVLGSLGQNLIAQSKATLDAVAAIPVGEHTYANTIGAMSEEERLSQALGSSLDFVSDVSPDKVLRDASNVAKEAISAYAVDAAARYDVYQSVNHFASTSEAKALTGEKARLLEYIMRDFKRMGLHLEQDSREKLVEIKKKMSSLSIKFHANLGEENTTFHFTKDQLQGLSADQLSALKLISEGEHIGTYEVSLKTPDYIPVMQFCQVPATRQQLEYAYNRRCIDENTPIIEELVVLRAQEAVLLGYDTHADYVLDIRMAKKKEVVADFLDSLNHKLTPLFEADQVALLELKRVDCDKRGLEFDGKLNAWDRAYYARVYEEEHFKIDHEMLKEYFPLDTVTQGIFKIYQNLFSFRFEEITNIHAWHNDVKLYRVWDTSAGREGLEVGQFYIDLHPRQGKYGHAAVFPLISSCQSKDGRVIPVSGLVCNFPKSTAEKPSLLTHRDVVTYFHECGHVFHHISSQTQQLRFSGTNVARDFVEAPSQMLENFCWNKQSLSLMMGHYKDGSLASDEIVDSLIKSQIALAGSFNKRQLVFGIVDQRMHTRSSADTAQLYAEVTKEVMGVYPTVGTNMIASFGHLAGGYDASYYGYMWSNVYAVDMFSSRFLQEGLLNPKVGLEYRKIILENGDSEDAMILLERFLGRPPNDEAFIKHLGL